MLTIRDEQMDAFRSARRTNLHHRILERAASEAPELCAGRTREENLALIEQAHAEGPRFGFFEETHVERHARFLMRFGADYRNVEECKPAVAILDDIETIGADKLDRIEALLLGK